MYNYRWHHRVLPTLARVPTMTETRQPQHVTMCNTRFSYVDHPLLVDYFVLDMIHGSYHPQEEALLVDTPLEIHQSTSLTWLLHKWLALKCFPIVIPFHSCLQSLVWNNHPYNLYICFPVFYRWSTKGGLYGQVSLSINNGRNPPNATHDW